MEALGSVELRDSSYSSIRGTRWGKGFWIGVSMGQGSPWAEVLSGLWLSIGQSVFLGQGSPWAGIFLELWVSVEQGLIGLSLLLPDFLPFFFEQ